LSDPISPAQPVKASRGSNRDYPEIGDRLRVARRSHRLSLRELAKRLGVSPSLISQIETGRAQPSVSSLYAIAGELNVSLDELLFNAGRRGGVNGRPTEDPESPPLTSIPGGPVQRAGDRKEIRLASGVVWDRLTTESIPGIDFLYVTYEAGGASSPEHEFQRHGGHEWGFVLEGTLTVTIGFDEYELGPGDSVSIASTTPHRLHNRGQLPVHAVWFVLGRRTVDLTARSAEVLNLDGLSGNGELPGLAD
jgi:transcriptional regulator with XRE-family HTH domain/mannose-6-phosphate isomerase-like protein (cupin superfamily)